MSELKIKLRDFWDDLIFFFSEQYWELFIEFTDHEIGLLNTRASNLPRKGFLLRLAIFGFGLLRSIFSRIKRTTENIAVRFVGPELLILSGSTNEYKSTKFLERNNNLNISYLGTVKNDGCAPFEVYLFGALFLPFLILRFLISPPEKRILYQYLTDQFLLVMGWRFLQRNIYRRRNIRGVVYSNHMSPISRSAVLLARQYSDATIIYVEHTPILTYWPMVEADVYFLSGEFSLENLKRRTKLQGKEFFLAGSPKNDVIKYRKNNDKHRKIGLCVSPTDDLRIVRKLILDLLSRDAQINLIIRPHPSFRNFEEQLALIHQKIQVIAPNSQSVQDFLASIGKLIVDDSGLFFEGLLAGVNVFRVKLSHESSNNYGVPDEYSPILDTTSDEVIVKVLSVPSNNVSREKLNFFHGNLNTNFENNSSEIISLAISSYCPISNVVARKIMIDNFFSRSTEDGCYIYKLFEH
ncbi:hypothetical protein N8144_03350 [Planktomarina temperata]|nr:hypothetical protein [Planktomarina temperata]